MTHEIFEEHELARRKFDCGSPDTDLSCRRIEFERTGREDGWPFPCAAPQKGADPRKQLVERKGLGQIIVGPAIESCHPVGHCIFRRQHDDGCPLLSPPHPPQDVKSVSIRQHDIENDRIIGILGPHPEGIFGRCRYIDGIILLMQSPLQQRRHFSFIFYNENPHTGRIILSYESPAAFSQLPHWGSTATRMYLFHSIPTQMRTK